jgi:hypothetical protein
MNHPPRRFFPFAFLLVAQAAACSSATVGETNPTNDDGTAGTNVAATGGSSNVGAGGASVGAGGANTSSMGGGGSAAKMPGGGTEVTVKTALPDLPKFGKVTATAVDDNVNISFDPVDGARDYRVYALPDDKDVSSDASGHVTVKNAIYRCAGDRQAPSTNVDGAKPVQGNNITTLVDGQKVDGYTRTLPEATLGYVYTTPGMGRVPVYALGDPAANGDSDCDFLGITTQWQESRSKTYTTSDSERTMLLGQNWRDDGIAFYVPAAAASGTKSVYTATKVDNIWTTRYYYIDGPEAAMRGKTETAFQVLGAAAADTQPLMRVFYQNGCGRSHDELTVGKSRFDRARIQGDEQPVFGLHWAGITGPTTLVVEALADGCPYQGFFGAQSEPARDVYPTWLTLDQLHAASSTGEVYINGQHMAGVNPKPIARSFIQIEPGPKPDLDWFNGFHDASSMGSMMMDTKCGALDGNCWQQFRRVSNTLDLSFMFVETDRWAFAPILGELWVNFGDVGADVNGKFRLTPSTKATLAADTYVYTTMTVDTFSTGRRYPQMIISDQDVPVQINMQKGYAIVIQTFGGWPNTYEVQACDHQYWDVNNQCPKYDLHHVYDPNDATKVTGLLPNAEIGEHSGMDRATKLEAYASSKHVFLFMDGEPYGCADLPSSTVPNGPVTMTYGDVLYHSGVDLTFAYTHEALQVSTRRHFDNLGFKSGVAAPEWDFKRLPCATNLKK